MDFEAEIVPRGDGTYRFGMEVGLIPPDDQAPAIIGALGGSAVEITIGAEMTTSLPNDVATKSGVSPDPF